MAKRSTARNKIIPQARVSLATLWVVLFTATMAFGQTPTQKAALSHRGHAKISIGAGLIAFGLLATPAEGRMPPAGIGLTMAGGSLIFWGVRDLQRARQPSLTFGVTAGRMSAIQIRRKW
jgi:hypothetical protein